MFEPRNRESEFARLVKEGRERVGEPLDFNTLVLWKLASVNAAPAHSGTRHKELSDLEHMLHPYLDEEYRAWRRAFAARRERCKAHSEYKEWDESYQGEWIGALADLLKRNGLTALGMV
jgi:hypothetical protein